MKKRLILAFIVLVLGWHAAVLLPLAWVQQPDVGQLEVYDRHDQLIAHLPRPDGLRIPLKATDTIPDQLIGALLRIEDERFYDHWGVNALAKLRALRDNLWAREIVSGGSTLTEQYLKNRFFPESPRTILQKAREATLAWYVSLLQSKEEVLRAYLNQVYFGHRNYGLRAAMLSYFDKTHLETLTRSEIVTLLAILRSPGVINTQEEYFQERFQRIADQLGWDGVAIPDMTLEPFKGFDRFPHVTAAIRQRDAASKVLTTIDSSLQEQARELISQTLTRLAGKQVSNAAVYVVQPQTGDILVWQGSKDFWAEDIDGQVNVLTQRRQMGSALKPFIYLYAFTQGAHPDQLIVDLEKDFQTEKTDESYRPLNYGLREGGIMPLKMALANSFNIASVRLLDELGLQESYAFMKDRGLPFDQPAEHYGLSLALGSSDLPLKAVADSYGGLARGGSRVEGHLLRTEFTEAEGPDQSLAIPLFHLWTTLSNPLHRRRSFGAHSILNTSIPFAVKTGTTKNFHDNWTFGYHPDLVVATWVGNNDNRPMIDVDGITGAGPIWHRVVEAAIDAGYVDRRQPESPEDLSRQLKCRDGDCRQTELIYQKDSRQWLSDLDKGHYCREDFFIPEIEAAEIVKVAKLFDFADFSIEWCDRERKHEGNATAEEKQDLTILKPKDGEVFYLRPDIPAELQEIILKANTSVKWQINGQALGSGQTFFLRPEPGKHQIQARSAGEEKSVTISVRELP